MSDNEKKYSSIWDYFEKSDEDKQARCLICNNCISYKSTSHNLRAHLKKRHPNQCKNLPPCRTVPTTPMGSKKNRKILWGYFSRLVGKDKLATCNLCDRILSYKTTNGNLKAHLRRIHKEAYERLTENLPPELDYEEVYMEFEEDSNQSVPKALSEIWTYFEREGSERARCVVCRELMGNRTWLMKEHLREHHSKLLAQLSEDADGDDESDVNDEEKEDDMYTEIVYLDDNIDSYNKEQSVASPKATEKLKIPTKKHKLPVTKRNNSSSCDEEVLAKNKETDDGDNEEIDKFGNYMTYLLKKMPRDVSTKLQMDILNLVMNTKLKLKQKCNQVPNTNESTTENRVTLDGLPVTLQTVTELPGAGYIVTVPNNINNNQKDSLIAKALNASLNERDRCSSTVSSQGNRVVEFNNSSVSGMSNTMSSTDSVANTFASHGYSFAIATTSLNNEKVDGSNDK